MTIADAMKEEIERMRKDMNYSDSESDEDWEPSDSD